MSDPTNPTAGNSDLNQRLAQADKLINDLSLQRDALNKLIEEARDQLKATQAEITITKNDAEIIKKASVAADIAIEQIEKAKKTSLEGVSGIETASTSVKAASKKFDELASEAQKQHDQCSEKQHLLSGQLSEIEKVAATFNERQESLSHIASEIEQLRLVTEEKATSVNENSTSVASIRAELESLKENAEATQTSLHEEELQIKRQLEDINASVKDLELKRGTLGALLSEIEAIKASTETAKAKTLEDSEAVSQVKSSFDGLKTETQTAHDDLVNRHAQTVEKIAEIDGINDRIRAARLELLDDHDVDGKPVKSVATKIREQSDSATNLVEEISNHAAQAKSDWNSQLSKAQSDWEGKVADFNGQLTQLVQQSTVQVDKLKTDLTNEIRKLLPGAGAAGLSWAYYDAKTMYGPGKFEYEGDAKDHWSKKATSWIGFALQYRTARLMFYVLFLGPALLIAYYFYELMAFMLKHPANFDPNLILFRTLISVPLATISFFGWSSIRLYRRLYEEYNHKQRVMQLYESFKKEIESAGTDDQRKALLTIMLNTVGDKPTLAMHSYDKGFEFPWPKIKASTEVGLSPAESQAGS